MTRRDRHIPTDRLTALAFVARAPQQGAPSTSEDTLAFEHIARCDKCAARFSQFTIDADSLRDVAFAEADAVFDTAMLDGQRTRILDRLAHLGQTARVISFPARHRDVTMPVTSSGRRWISVAAAAGLIIGLVAGQLLHLVPSTPIPAREDLTSIQVSDRSASPAMIAVSTTSRPLSEDELIEEVEAAVQLRRAESLQAIDALTPTAADLLALGRD
jgi:hypothetical protein